MKLHIDSERRRCFVQAYRERKNPAQRQDFYTILTHQYIRWQVIAMNSVFL